MKKIREEFEDYLKAVVESYPTANTNILQDSTKSSELATASRIYNSKVDEKIKELASSSSHNAAILKIELSDLIVQYHSTLVANYL